MSSSAVTSKLFFKTVSSLCGFAGTDAGPIWHDVSPSLALNAISPSITSERALRSVGWQLVKVARQAALAKRMDLVKEVSEAIIRLPLPDEIKTVGHFYNAILEERAGNIERARVVLTEIACAPRSPCRSRAVLEIGKTFFDNGQPTAALPLYVEAARLARQKDLIAAIRAHIMIAVVRSIDGDHCGALSDLERLWPMVRLASAEHPALHSDFLNSLAVELAETGRIQEAKHAVEIALRSPFADRYPNWKATRDEIADKERRASYRPRLLSLAGRSLKASTDLPDRTPAGVQRAETVADRRDDLCSKIQELSPNRTGLFDPEYHTRSSADDAVLPADAFETVILPGVDPEKSLILVPSFIRLGIKPSKTGVEAASLGPITIIQRALAPNSSKPLRKRAVVSTSLLEASAHSRMSEGSAWCCHAIGDPPDNIWAGDGYPKSPRARGPPATSIER